jgi:hypothetical protein
VAPVATGVSPVVSSPQTLRLWAIFFLTVVQVSVVRKDSGQRRTIVWKSSQGTAKLSSSGRWYLRALGSHPPSTARSFPWDR